MVADKQLPQNLARIQLWVLCVLLRHKVIIPMLPGGGIPSNSYGAH